MARLGDLFDLDLLEDMVQGGYVRVQTHPSLPLSILNYTDKAAWDRRWNPVTVQCRGLIAHRDTGKIVARGFDKFWNASEPEAAGIIRLDEPVTVTAKQDGSLGICFPTGDVRYAIATRGSFASTQAIHATRVWEERYADRWAPPEGMTALYEIVFPENRIVLDYKGLDDLILLGFVETETGRTHGPWDFKHGWPGPVTEFLPYQSFTEALADEPCEGVEGYVVHFRESDRRVKIKGAWYVQMHRLVTGLTVRVLWEHLAFNECEKHGETEFLVRRLMMGPDRIDRIRNAGPDWFDSFIEGVPDELYQWVVDNVAELKLSVSYLRHQIKMDYAKLVKEARGDRKEFALMAKTEPHAGALFSLRDGREIDTYLWREVRPEHETPFMKRTEDVA